MATEEWALQLRPTSFLEDPAVYPGPQILNLNPSEEGIYLGITSFVPRDGADPSPVLTALQNIARALKNYGSGIAWTVTSDGGQKAVSLPQQTIDNTQANAQHVLLYSVCQTMQPKPSLYQNKNYR